LDIVKVKVKLIQASCHEGIGGVDVKLHEFVTSALDRGFGSLQASAALLFGWKTGTGAGLDVEGNRIVHSTSKNQSMVFRLVIGLYLVRHGNKSESMELRLPSYRPQN
jgi:hypothetical protein